MDVEGFVRWALAQERTLEERFTVERLVERFNQQWQIRNQTGKYERWEVAAERKRQRKFNPAYQPACKETELRRAVEILAEQKELPPQYEGDDRPLRDWSVLRWLPQLEAVELSGPVTDLTPLLALPQLRKLSVSSSECEDFSVVAQCRGLQHLSLGFSRPWPELGRLENLAELETLGLSGNLLALPRGLIWPKVTKATLSNLRLPVRNLHALPQLPACEILHLTGSERLDGIEAMPKLRNLTITDEVRSFEPLTALKELTGLRYHAGLPLDVSPLARLPKLLVAFFPYSSGFHLDVAGLRDYSPFVEAPALRELVVTGCPPVETEVAAINAGLPPWGDVFLRPEPRPLPPLKLIVAPNQRHPRPPERPANEVEDPMVAECETVWVNHFVTRTISKAVGAADWGEVQMYAGSRSFSVTVESFGVVEKFSIILEAMRTALARLRPEYGGHFMIALKAPRLTPSPAQQELDEKFRREQDEAEFERSRKEQEAYWDRLRRFQLKKDEGSPIKPGEFAAPPPTPLPPPPWEREDEEDEGDDAGDVAVKKKPDPPPSFLDDEHPLADNYRLYGALTLSEAWFLPHHRALAAYLMGRQPDLEIPEEPKP